MIKTIILTNDDGIKARGLNLLKEILDNDYRVIIVAPDRENSATGHGITVRRDLYVTKLEEDIYMVNGTPADCTRIALGGLFDFKIDLVISGINHGMNIGWDVYYSGTVAAARESIMKRTPAIAISQKVDYSHKTINNSTCTKYTNMIVDFANKNRLPINTMLNINIPNLDVEQVKGLRLTHIGMRFYKEDINLSFKDTFSQKINFAWMPVQSKEPQSDCKLLEEGFVTISPISIDPTDYEYLEKLNELMKNRVF